ncbi:MAG: glycosyltransferase family 2 protein [Gemmatimonadota bacterium]
MEAAESGPQIGVIVSAYERPQALAMVLASLCEQTYRRFEIVVADDGSGQSTRRLVEQVAAEGRVRLRHVWHEDLGFRLAAIRNRAIAVLETDYLLFMDGDCLVRSNFLARHARLAERGRFVRGSRVHLGRELTAEALDTGLDVHQWSTLRWLGQRLSGRVDRFTPLVSLPLGGLRKMSPRKWDGSKGCNLAVWRDDAIAVNGFDESYQGWGSEDNDFVVRLIRLGVYRKDGRCAAPVLHLWHPERQREQDNLVRFERRLRSNESWAERGLDQYL